MSTKNPKTVPALLLGAIIITLVMLIFWQPSLGLNSILIPSLIASILIFVFGGIIKYTDKDYWKDMGIIITISLTGIGWFVNGYLAGQRDIENRQRELKTKYLLNAYYRLENGFSRGPIDSMSPEEYVYKKYEESAVGSIGLLSNLKTIKAANEWLYAINDNKKYLDSNRAVIDALRKELRSELKLEPIPENTGNLYRMNSLRITNAFKMTTWDSKDLFNLILKLNENDVK